MFRSFFKSAFRSLIWQGRFSFINITGLAIGITSCLLIMIYVVDELSYDRFHKKADRMYKVYTESSIDGEESRIASTSGPLAIVLAEEFPEVEDAVRVYEFSEMLVRNGDKVFSEKDVFAVDSSFFEVFSFDLLEGNPQKALVEPRTVVLTEKTARKYFGNESPVEKPLLLRGEPFKVTGVVQNPPSNSHWQFDFLVSISSRPRLRYSTDWISSNLFTYFTLKEGASASALEAKLPMLVEKYAGPQLQGTFGYNLEDFKKRGNFLAYHLMPLTDIHLRNDLLYEIEPQGNIEYVYLFSVIAFFILLIACINFMNLSTARSAKRAKEVGMRKVLGSQKGQLMLQFLGESLLYCTIATLIALILTYALLPLFNSISGKALTASVFGDLRFIAGIAVSTLVISLLAGSYPAFYLTAFKPIEVLKGRLRSGVKSSGLRSTLVVFQFATSIALIICTFLVYSQLQYMKNRSMGFDKENVLVISNSNNRLKDNVQAFKTALGGYSSVASVSISDNIPASDRFNKVIFNKDNSPVNYTFEYMHADYTYPKTMGLKMVLGRPFSRDFPSDSSAIIINETAMKQLGWQNAPGKSPIGQFMTHADKRYQVVGVVRDFNFESLRKKVEPVAITLGEWGDYVSIRFEPSRMQSTLGLLEQQWRTYAPNTPFEYQFMDDSFDALFRAEQRLGKIFTLFTSLAIFIACLGLLGLSIFIAEQRTKETSIRKVLGANMEDIVFTLSKSFLKLVLIANLIAWPLAWYGMNRWLQNFAFREDIKVWIFLVATAIAFLITILTVGIQAMKVATLNPIKYLRGD